MKVAASTRQYARHRTDVMAKQNPLCLMVNMWNTQRPDKHTDTAEALGRLFMTVEDVFFAGAETEESVLRGSGIWLVRKELWMFLNHVQGDVKSIRNNDDAPSKSEQIKIYVLTFWLNTNLNPSLV